MFGVSSINTSSRGKRFCVPAHRESFSFCQNTFMFSNLDLDLLEVEVSHIITVNFGADRQHALDQTFDVVER